jgi:4-amino-4-deoxy-L-arabinose transferase-like glycosyltransferase
VLLVAALAYYGIYWRSGLMLSGEEGVAAVIAQRLNAGQLPIVDTFLGYNVGWFYPIAFIFKLTGPNYLIMRAYFFLMAGMAGMAAYTTVWLVSRRALLSFVAGLLVILMPGVIGRNYMGFLGVLGMLVLLGTFILPPRRTALQIVWMVALGISTSLAWLIRIDLGFFQTALFLLTALLFILKPERGTLRRLGLAATATALLCASFIAIHGPVYRDAAQRGFGRQLAEQYWVWPSMIRSGALQLLNQYTKPRVPIPASTTAPIGTPTPIQGASPATPSTTQMTQAPKEIPASSASYSETSLKRPSVADILHATKLKDRAFALLIYLPVPVSALVIAWGLLLLLGSLVSRDPELWKQGGILLVSIGSSLSLFPQYFFWRPDMIHLGEFMVPFTVTLVIGLYLAASGWPDSSRWKRVLLFLIMIPATLDLGLYAIKGWQTDGAGSIAASRKRHLEFTALNGVHVKLNSQEFSRSVLLRDSILSHSKKGDYVVCYPYFPMVNFMTDRPSYEYNLYADNAIPPERFFSDAVANMRKYRPAVIVIGTGNVNSTEASRFQNWASKTYAYIKEHYSLVASKDEMEIYASQPATTPSPEPTRP